ncbi:hypothetical protein EJ02DRAFT_433079 [Clathrospora elynae]|uniref:Uncharacterized protein n=1 Tax=Clathrospora elynae TaxID=706981 RepID=A0A6A5STK9_9PLEO|nr:hypothetical protein EJ02DRAFT_433079 [Clathrospora elynae]
MSTEPPANPTLVDAPRPSLPSSTELGEREQHGLGSAPFRAVPKEFFKVQLPKHVDPTNYFTTECVRVQRRTEGANHHAVILQIGPARFGVNYRADKDSIDNELSVPYIFIRKLPGKMAYHTWFDQNDEEGENMDFPSGQKMKKRETFLKSLAHHMAKLQKLDFDKIDMLNFDNDIDAPVVVHSWETLDGVRMKRLAWPADLALDDISGNDVEKNERETHQHRGMRKIMDMILTAPPFATSKPQPDDENEKFVLRHPDLDLQNILTDSGGNVTGILDWHEAVTTPRCIGYAALPHFLTHDWHPRFTLEDSLYMSWSVDHYRCICVNAMNEACAEARWNDGKYTYKSVMYQAVYAAVTRGGSAPDLVNKTLLQLPGLRFMDLDEFQERPGRVLEGCWGLFRGGNSEIDGCGKDIGGTSFE